MPCVVTGKRMRFPASGARWFMRRRMPVMQCWRGWQRNGLPLVLLRTADKGGRLLPSGCLASRERASRGAHGSEPRPRQCAGMVFSRRPVVVGHEVSGGKQSRWQEKRALSRPCLLLPFSPVVSENLSHLARLYRNERTVESHFAAGCTVLVFYFVVDQQPDEFCTRASGVHIGRYG